MRSPNSQDTLFESARHRLDAQKRLGKQFFTSDLSTNEYLLTREAGCEPIGMVMGSSFYKVGFFGYFRGYRDRTGEVETLTQAQLAVRELAVSRMQQEAALLGAHGVSVVVSNRQWISVLWHGRKLAALPVHLW